MTERLAGDIAGASDSRVNLCAVALERVRGKAVALAVAGTALGLLTGCEVDSFLDPSVVGRWENTPSIVPVLERIDVIERDTGEFVDVTPVMPEDLLPEATEHRVGPGDGMIIIILDFYASGTEARFEQLVDQRGYLRLPQVPGEIYVNKMTREEVERVIGQAVREAGLLQDPLVEVQIPGSRQATFSIFGIVDRVGRYSVPTPDYRLLEALTDAGGVPSSIEKVFIIRQVSLTGETAAPPAATPGPAPKFPTEPPPAQPPRRPEGEQGQDLLEIINELTAPQGEQAPPAEAPPPAPPPKSEPEPSIEAQDLESILEPEPEKKPETQRTTPNPGSPGILGTNKPAPASIRKPNLERPGAARSVMQAPDSRESSKPSEPREPPIDLIDQESPLSAPAAPAPPTAAVATHGRWVFFNGEWVQVVQSAPALDPSGLPEGEDPLSSAPAAADDIITQRVIEVPVAPLIQGVAQYNLVVRPGDTISVPGPKQGFVYLTGPGISRPGVYQLPFTGKLTLQRLIASAGGLSPIAIPERVDLVRMVGDDRQAFVRLNLRAISEGTQPDLFLKPDDLVNVGTNFWATPLAVVRGGLRASYGFGFLLDRNFGNDVFGPPPTDQFGN